MASTATWPELQGDHPIIVLFKKVPEVLTASDGYNELWGLTLTAPAIAEPEGDSVEQPTFATALILQKFLRANANDINKAFSQLKDTMVWRKTFFAADGEISKGWSDEKFKGLGYLTTINHKSGVQKVVCWNVYGATKDIKKTFGSLDEFIRWRVNLMEESLKRLKLAEATEPIPDFGKGADPYMGIQVHDYKSVSFLRLPSEVKTASKKTIEMFARYYPETLERKYFVNVPTIMSWVYTLLKKILSAATLSKLEMLPNCKDLVKKLGEDIPEAYGGKGQPLDTIEASELTSPRNVDGELAAQKAEEEATKAEEVTKEETKEETNVEEPAKETETKAEEAPAASVEATEATPAPVTETDKPIEPLPLTEEPVTTAAPIVAAEATEATVTPEAPADAPAAPKELADVPLPAPTEVNAPAPAEKKEDDVVKV